MRRCAEVTLWILAGSALTGGVYWVFLNTPESTIWTLVMSATLSVIVLALLAITVNGALAGWSEGFTRKMVSQSIARTPLIGPAGVIVMIAWWVVGRATGWISAHSGQISAWFIARLGWADVSPLFTGIDWAGWWIRWILAPMIALSLMAAFTGPGWPVAVRAGWMRRAISPLHLAIATLWFLLLVAAPWVYLAPWRPAGLPPTSIEPMFIALKLAASALLMAIGVALITREISRV